MKRSSLENYVLSYKVRDESGEEVPLISIEDYHKRFIQTLDSRFSRWNFYNSAKVLCWFKDHADKNPSMGLVNDRHLKGVKLYHCLGCGKTGNVIRLHQYIQKAYHNRTLTDNESALELCKLYGIDISGYEEKECEDIVYSQLREVQSIQSDYSSREFSDDLLDARKNFAKTGDVDKLKKSLNSATVKMVAMHNGWLKN